MIDFGHINEEKEEEGRAKDTRCMAAKHSQFVRQEYLKNSENKCETGNR